ncbi:MAG: ribbon-helix-helix protein, CopG family [Actinomycetota bacterium]|nr:ribbon-helix-helix protein, CopG family [Actinomycetota bacterium]
MDRKTKVISISLPEEMAEELEDLSKAKGRTKTDLIKEMFKTYNELTAEKEWSELFKSGRETAKNFKIKNDEDLYNYLKK